MGLREWKWGVDTIGVVSRDGEAGWGECAEAVLGAGRERGGEQEEEEEGEGAKGEKRVPSP